MDYSFECIGRQCRSCARHHGLGPLDQMVTGRNTAFRRSLMHMEGRLNIDDLITHTMPLDQINTAFDLMHAGESIRVVVYE